jgi:NAD(P)-dependent dehydrogenase (short-subunit alcohol dehydrogenase family)
MHSVILITGASSGIGKAMAEKLLDEGHTVYCSARKTESMEELAQRGGKLLALDVTVDDQIQSAIETIIAEQGRLDVLCNNAGYGLYGAVEDIPLEDARSQFDVNLFGVARVTREALPHMRTAGGGKIINTSSMGGKMYTPMGAWYHATKYALEGWSDCLRLEVAPHGIDVVLIEPGAINTGFGDPMQQSLKKYSGEGAYAPMAKGMIAASKETYTRATGSPPSVVANAVARAVRSSRPKTRYAVGKYAKLFILVRKLTPDRIFDRLVSLMVKRTG